MGEEEFQQREHEVHDAEAQVLMQVVQELRMRLRKGAEHDAEVMRSMIEREVVRLMAMGLSREDAERIAHRAIEKVTRPDGG